MKKSFILSSIVGLTLTYSNFCNADVVLVLDSVQDAQYRKVMALAQSVVTSKIYEITTYKFQKVSSYGEFCVVTVGDEAELMQHLKDQMGDDKTVSIRTETGYCK